MRRVRYHALPICAAGFLAVAAGAVPPDAAAGPLRELSPDRPDVTEGPFTVDAGHVQWEMDFASYTRGRRAGGRTTALGIATGNFRYGVRSDFEAGFFVSPWVRTTAPDGDGPRTTRAGFGDFVLRGKWNFWGNDGGGTAGGLIVDVKLPTAARGLGNGRLEGAVTLPFAAELPGGWEFGAMTELEAAHRDEGGRRGVWTNSATLGHELTRNTSGYVELVSTAGEGAHQMTLDGGVAWRLDRDTQLDAGVNLGVSRTAPDVQVFAGLTRRF